MTCAPVSLSGLSRTGFMWIDVGTPAARACRAWARPISPPPSSVTAALFDMFCGLNGRTRSPRRTKTRASPATSMDLPTLEPAPWIINVALMTACSLDPQRLAGHDQYHLIRDRPDILREPPRRIAELPCQTILRHDAEADLVGDEHDRALLAHERGAERFALGAEIALGEEQVRQPERQAIDETRARAISGIERADEIERGGVVAPARIAARLMGGDAPAHFVVEGLGRRYIDRATAHGQHALFGMAALARSRAAGDQDDAHGHGSSSTA